MSQLRDGRLLTAGQFEALRDTRAHRPEDVRIALRNRRRRDSLLAEDGRLFIIAADHPARGALGVRSDQMAMADRYDLLDRLALALSRPGVDGLLATPDIVDDLATLGVLDDKIVVGSMNRGGLSGASFEMDDRFTAYDIDAIKRDGLDFAKTLLRIDLEDAGSVATIESTARAVDEAALAKVPIMLEPFLSARRDGRVLNDLSPQAVIRSVSVASGLGNSSAYTWMKLPVVDEMERVMASTTMPTLLLGGDPQGAPDATFTRWQHALALPGVRGLVVGRTLVYPQDGDVASAVDQAAQLVHGRALSPALQ
ncbi:DhnA family fructose-bisphosphate aldolase class Ia [Mycetocola sp. CAN_C7]|uniref:Cgl0159 family (beta/alpha)8-fold protein n=1 Tax=Mycetocola sp. CAN_C7 TaxID=2787724 RepID=UPI0018C9F1A0